MKIKNFIDLNEYVTFDDADIVQDVVNLAQTEGKSVLAFILDDIGDKTDIKKIRGIVKKDEGEIFFEDVNGAKWRDITLIKKKMPCEDCGQLIGFEVDLDPWEQDRNGKNVYAVLCIDCYNERVRDI